MQTRIPLTVFQCQVAHGLYGVCGINVRDVANNGKAGWAGDWLEFRHFGVKNNSKKKLKGQENRYTLVEC
jgi:hypothetical protein